MFTIDLKREGITYYLLNYISIYENQYVQQIDYLLFYEPIVDLKTEEPKIFKVGLKNIFKFLSHFVSCQFSINDEKEVVLICNNGIKEIHLKIYMVTDEKCKKFPSLNFQLNELNLNLFLYALESFTTIKFKKNILNDYIPSEFK